MNRESIEKISGVLRADRDDIAQLERDLGEATGKMGVMSKIAEENGARVDDSLRRLGLSRKSSAREVYDALISKIEADDHKLAEAMGMPDVSDARDCEMVLDRIEKAVGKSDGYFLKLEKAEEFLRRKPPRNILEYLGYPSVDEMIKNEDIFEIYSALRFVENREWMNKEFLPQYRALAPADFEDRKLTLRVLDKKWNEKAQEFLHKKWHNISHLKELGVVFIIPSALGISGELLRMISLVLHYIYEVPFYSGLFRKSAEVPELFSEHVISLLRGDVIDRRLAKPEGKSLWLVVQRYLAKEDPYDWRLSVPHISPEAYHWARAEKTLVSLGDELDGFEEDLIFWLGLGWVGDYFKDDAGSDVLVSFDLVDTVMSLVKRKELIKYLYHQQEALWNKIFTEYFGEDGLEYFLKEYLLQGYFEI